MKKRILLALFLVLCLTFALCACGDDEDTEPSGKDSTTNTSSVDNSKTESKPEADNGNGGTSNGGNGGTNNGSGNQKPKEESKGLEFSLNEDGASYSVESIGSCMDTDIVIPSKYEGKAVTSIGEYAFYECTSLTSIVLPEGVTSIGSFAFYYCTSLTSIVLPEGVTSIGEGAFYCCASLTRIEIPEGVTKIDEGAFWNCTSLTSIEVSPNNPVYKSISGNLYTKDGKTLIQYAIGKTDTKFAIPESVTSIGKYAFGGCTSLTSIEIPRSMTSLGKNAFSKCAITNIVIPEWIKSIEEEAFEECYNLTSVEILEGLTYIGEEAFDECSSLTSINLPNSLTSIGGGAFYGCKALTSIEIPKGVTSIGGSAFYGCTSLTIYCEAEEKPDGWNVLSCPVVWNCNNNEVASDGCIYTVIDGIRYGIKDGVATVERQPSNIKGAIVIPESITYKGANYQVTSIGYRAFFYYCTSLTSILLPEGVTSIGEDAFHGCTSLTSIEIPESVTSIGYQAFFGCDSLTIYCEAEKKPDGWHEYWNLSGCPVVWNCNNNEVASDGCIYTVIDGIRYGIKDGVATVVRQPSNIEGAIVILGSITYKGANYQVTSIGYRAFEFCTSLTSIVLPEGVTSIGGCAFSYCTSLTSIEIPEGVTSIGDEAFHYCTSLTIYCKAESQPDSWYSNWNYSNCPVEWGYKG